MAGKAASNGEHFMRFKLGRLAIIIAALSAALLGVACHQQTSVSTQPQGFEHLPDATNVTAALDQKDYETAVSGLVKLKESIATDEQQKEYRLLTGQVQEKLLEASTSDPKAADAMKALHMLISGR
jgi:hypothetical protein